MKHALRAGGLRGGFHLFLAGSLWCLAFAPLSWAWVQALSLLLGWKLLGQAGVGMPSVSIRKAFGHGWVYGFGMFAAGVCWLYISLHDFGGVPAPVAAFAVLALAAYMALFPALAVALSHAISVRLSRRRDALMPAVFAGAWVFAEWLRATLFTGFPWLSTGEAWIDTPLAGFYPLVGSQGVALLVVWSVMSLRVGMGGFARTGSVRLGLHVGGLLPLITVLAGGYWLQSADWGNREQASVRVHIVQPNVSQTIKFDPDHITQNFIDTVLLGREAADHSDPGDWLLFPETALPVLWQEAPVSWRNAFAGLAWEHQTPVIMGAALQDGPDVYTNSVIALRPDQANAPETPQFRYDKRHLVPFGEFIPPGFRWFVDLMNMPLGDFTRGRGAPVPFTLGSLRVLPNVCYEDVFGHELADLVRQASDEPHILFNVSNLAWFGGSWALEQHGQMSRVRAAEQRKPMLRATNTGISGVIDAKGQWVLRLPANERAAASASVTGMQGLTPFVRYGLLVPVVLLLVLFLLGSASRRASGFADPHPRNVQ